MEPSKHKSLMESGSSWQDALMLGTKVVSLGRKLSVIFLAMFFVVIMAAIFLFKGFFENSTYESFAQITLFFFSVFLLMAAGYLASMYVIKTLLKTTKEVEAVANGDTSRRIIIEGDSEVNQLANHFNRIVEQLEKTIENLRASRKLTHDLLSQLCALGGQPGDMSPVFETFMKTLLSVTSFDVGAMFIVSTEGNMLRARVMVGLPKVLRGIVIPVGHGAAGRVASTGHTEVISELMSEEAGEMSEFDKSMSCSLHVPMITAGRIRGVVSIGLTEGQIEVSLEDTYLVRNLASQIAVALENMEYRRKEEKTYIETIAALATAVEARDTLTRGHSRRVTEFSVAIARSMNKPDWFIKDVEAAALLHDIGKIGFSDEILFNVDPVPLKDMHLIRNHPLMGENILKPVGSLSRLCPIIRHHHERYDGSGYPDGMKGEDIPLASRIIAVADSFDAMLSGRHYLPHREIEEVVDELSRCSGTQFDPACLRVFLEYLASNSASASV